MAVLLSVEIARDPRIAHSGRMDELGALWIAVAAWMLSTGRG